MYLYMCPPKETTQEEKQQAMTSSLRQTAELLAKSKMLEDVWT